MANPIIHFEIFAQKGQKQALQDFYRETFGWQIDNTPPPMEYGMITKPEDEHGIGGAVDETPDGNAGVVIYLGVDDPQAYLDKAVANGASKVMDVTTIPGMVTFAQFKDPAGNLIGIVDNNMPSA